jgi:cell division protein FtsB|tara:strand:+ start:810 stop:1058 length:249 start_codon:yes stop_codon:yes gene_type:complete
MDITIIGWIWIGILIGAGVGILTMSLATTARIGDLEAEILNGRAIREALKEEIFRLENQAKPKPRKRRKKRVVKVDKIKVGK